MSGRIRNVTPKPGFVFDGRDVIPAPANVVPFRSTFAIDGALANIMSGRGTSVDRSSYDHWCLVQKTPQQIEAAYRSSWLCRQIVDIPAQDMTRAGRDWDAEDGDIEKIEGEEKRLGYWPKVLQALILGRLGGGAIIIGMKDRQPGAPLPSNVSLGDVEYLTVLSRHQIQVGEMDTDPASPFFGEPVMFSLSGGGRQVAIHPSRVIAFKGMTAPALYMSSWEDQYWGDSVLQTVDDAIKQATTATQGFASLIDEARVDVFTMPGMYETLAQPGGEAKFMAALQAAKQGKSSYRMLALGAGETWETRETSWAGIPDIIKTYLAIVAGAADIPATRLLGKSPDGQNATGESDLANYFQMVGARQERDLRPQLDRLDALVLPSAGVATDLTWQFSPLRVLTEAQQADIENKEALTLKTLVDTGMFSEVALEESFSNRMVESQRWPGYGEKREEQIKSGEFDPSDEPDESELGIVPIPGQTKGGDPTGQPGGNAQQPPARKAANDWFADATPRPLYVQRKLLNAADLIAWAKAQGFKSTLPAGDMHVTVLYSRNPVDPMKMGEGWDGDKDGGLTVKPGGPRAVEKLGENAIVLLFASWSLNSRHDDMVRAGATHDYEEYQPHVTISYEVPEGMDIEAIKPFTGELRFGPEVFEPLDLDWKSKITEEA